MRPIVSVFSKSDAQPRRTPGLGIALGTLPCIIEHMFYIGGREVTSNTSLVPGLTYRENWLSAEEQATLVAELDRLPWRRSAGRRTQVHTLRSRNCPQGVAELARQVARAGVVNSDPTRVEVVEYQPGEGETRGGPAGASWAALSLGSPCVMICEHPGRRLAVPVLLSPGGLLTHRVGAASAWQISVPGRKIDQFEGRRFSRGRRLALRMM